MRFVSASLAFFRHRSRSPFRSTTLLSLLTGSRRNMMYNLVLGGYRDTIPLVSFDPSTAKIKVVSETPAPEAPSWVEAAVKPAKGDDLRVIYCVSENEKEGEVCSVTLRADKMEITSRRKTRGAPCHSRSGSLGRCPRVVPDDGSLGAEGRVGDRRGQLHGRHGGVLPYRSGRHAVAVVGLAGPRIPVRVQGPQGTQRRAPGLAALAPGGRGSRRTHLLP